MRDIDHHPVSEHATAFPHVVRMIAQVAKILLSAAQRKLRTPRPSVKQTHMRRICICAGTCRANGMLQRERQRVSSPPTDEQVLSRMSERITGRSQK